MIFATGIITSGKDYPDFFIAMSLFAGIMFSHAFSGGHLNPAVTVALLITSDKETIFGNLKAFFIRIIA